MGFKGETLLKIGKTKSENSINGADLNFISSLAVLFIGIVVGLVVGAFIFWRGFNLGVGTEHPRFSYVDLSALILAALTILFAVFGALLAVFAFIGYRNIFKSVRVVSEETAKKSLNTSLQGGGELHIAILKEVSSDSELGRALIRRVHELYLASINEGREGDEEAEEIA